METMIELVKKYLNNQIEIVTIKTEQKLNTLVIQLVKYFTLFSLVASALLFTSLTLAMFLNNLFESKIWGFASVAALYIVFFTACLSKKGQKFLDKKIKALSKKILNNSIDKND